MAHDSSEHLRFDSRLAMRRGWIQPEKLDEYLAGLPDRLENVDLLTPQEALEAEAEGNVSKETSSD